MYNIGLLLALLLCVPTPRGGGLPGGVEITLVLLMIITIAVEVLLVLVQLLLLFVKRIEELEVWADVALGGSN